MASDISSAVRIRPIGWLLIACARLAAESGSAPASRALAMKSVSTAPGATALTGMPGARARSRAAGSAARDSGVPYASRVLVRHAPAMAGMTAQARMTSTAATAGLDKGGVHDGMVGDIGDVDSLVPEALHRLDIVA